MSRDIRIKLTRAELDSIAWWVTYYHNESNVNIEISMDSDSMRTIQSEDQIEYFNELYETYINWNLSTAKEMIIELHYNLLLIKFLNFIDIRLTDSTYDWDPELVRKFINLQQFVIKSLT